MGAQLMRVHYEFDRDRFMRPGADAEAGYAWFLGSQLNERDSLVLVGEREREVVAYLYAAIEPRNWQALLDRAGIVHDIFVDPAHRGAGIAEALMHTAFGWMRAHGVPRVVLSTATPNVRARRLFERLGFRHTMIEMTKELNPGG